MSQGVATPTTGTATNSPTLCGPMATAILRSPPSPARGCWRSSRRRPTSSPSSPRPDKAAASRSPPGPHGFARVDVPAEKDKDPPETRITLRRGVRLEARVVGPDGAPLDMVMSWCVERRASLLEEGRFRLDGADPERTYRVYFVDAKRGSAPSPT